MTGRSSSRCPSSLQAYLAPSANDPLTGWDADGCLPTLLVSAAFGIAGVGAFSVDEPTAKRRGTLGRY